MSSSEVKSQEIRKMPCMPCFFDELLCHVVKKPYAYPLTFTFFDEKLMPVVLEEYSSSVTKDPTLIDEIDDGSVCHLIRTRASKLFKSVVPKERKDDIMREARRAGLEWHPDEAELLCIEFNKRISDEISTKELEFGEDKQGFEEWRVNFYSSDYNKARALIEDRLSILATLRIFEGEEVHVCGAPKLRMLEVLRAFNPCFDQPDEASPLN